MILIHLLVIGWLALGYDSFLLVCRNGDFPEERRLAFVGVALFLLFTGAIPIIAVEVNRFYWWTRGKRWQPLAPRFWHEEISL